MIIAYLFIALLATGSYIDAAPGNKKKRTIQKTTQVNPQLPTAEKKDRKGSSESPVIAQAKKPAAPTPATQQVVEKKRKRYSEQPVVTAQAQPTRINKPMGQMNLAELTQTKDYLVAQNDKETALRYLERMTPLCNLDQMGPVILQTADVLFDTGSLAKAHEKYQEYYKLYPGEKKSAEHALYRSILSKNLLALDIDRDQTSTREALELVKTFKDKESIFTTYNLEVKNIERQCQQRLIDSELYVVSYYEKRKMYASATNRLRLIKTEYVSHFPELEPQLLYKELQIAQKGGAKDLITQNEQVLNERFPEYMAQLKSQKNASTRKA